MRLYLCVCQQRTSRTNVRFMCHFVAVGCDVNVAIQCSCNISAVVIKYILIKALINTDKPPQETGQRYET